METAPKASKSLTSSLKNIGGINNKEKLSGEDGSSSAHQEGGSESAAPFRPNPVVCLEEDENAEIQLHLRKRQNKGVSESGAGDDVVGVSFPDPAVPILVKDKGKGVEDRVINVAKMVFELCTDADWDRMSKAGINAILKEALFFGGAISQKQQEELNRVRLVADSVKEKDEKIKSLENKLASSRCSVEEKISGMKESLKISEEARQAAETRTSDLTKELELVKADLAARKSEQAVIDEFKKSKEYEEVLSDAAAAKIRRCWVVAERHIKTNPAVNWDSFCDHYIAAEEVIENGGPEPLPYDGPNPAFFPSRR